MKHKSELTIIFGKNEFLRKPFGLTQGPANFTALMPKVLGSFSDFCFIYMDDVLIYDLTKEDYLKHLKMSSGKLKKLD